MALAETKVVFPLRTVPSTFDPHNYDGIYAMVGMIQVHRGLLKFLPNLEIAPDLAESFKVLDGGKKLVFKLRNTKFANGEKLKAVHVVRSFQRMFKDKNTFAEDLNYIKNGHKILTGKADYRTLGVQALDEKTVELTLEHASGIVLSHLATIDSAIVPLDDKMQYDWKKAGGAGAYVVESVNDKVVVLRARPGEIEKGAPDMIELRKYSEPEAIAAALQGEVDSLDGYSVPKNISAKLVDRGWKTSVSTLTRQLFLVMNPKNVDAKTRRIISEALAAKDLDLLTPSYKRGAGIVPFGLAGALARPVPKGLKIEPLKKEKKVSLLIVNAEPLIPHLAEQIRSELARWNIKLEVKTITIAAYLDAVHNKPYDIILRSKHLDYPDGYSILTYFRSNYSENTFFIADKKIDALLDKAIAETETLKRADFYREIQELILKKHTMVPLVFGSDNLGLWSPKLAQVPAHPLGVQGLPFENLRMK